MKQTVISAELAKMFGLSERRIGQLVTENKIPKPTDGIFQLIETVSSYVRLLKERKDSAKFSKARLRKMEAVAQIAELDAGEKSRALLPVATVDRFLERLVREFISKIENSRMPREAQDELRRDLATALTEKEKFFTDECVEESENL